MMGGVGALVTLDPPGDSPVLDLPWIITFGPLSEEEDWEPVVCGPYERAHALALAESVLAEDDLMAVVEPVLPHVSIEQIRGDIAAARLAADVEPIEPAYLESEYAVEPGAEDGAEYGVAAGLAGTEPPPFAAPGPPPTVDEIRAGFARIAARLTAGPGEGQPAG